MPRFSYEEADNYGSQQYEGKINYFQLKKDGDKAYVHLLGDDMNDFPGYAVHQIVVGQSKAGKDIRRYVNCLRESGAPVTDCPFCAEGKHNPELSKVWAKLFIPVYACDTDEVQIWERGKTFFRTLASYCSHNPNVSEIVTEVERQGAAGDTSTTYGLYATRENDNFKMENIKDEIPEILGDVVLDKTYDEMEYFIRHGSFEDDAKSEDAGIARRGASRDEKPPFSEGNERRTPSRNRRTAEDEY